MHRFLWPGLFVALLICVLLFFVNGPFLFEDDYDHFPTFELNTNTGELWRLEDQDAQLTLVMFWASWCPACKRLFPEIQSLHEDYGQQGLKVVGVNFADDFDTVKFAHNFGLGFDIVLNGDALARDASVKGTPTVFLLDIDNAVRYRTSVSDPADPSLREQVRLLLRQ
ncbi:MAG: TlpA disulfide reductase family protein [Pseudomonadota bacterium]